MRKIIRSIDDAFGFSESGGCTLVLLAVVAPMVIVYLKWFTVDFLGGLFFG